MSQMAGKAISESPVKKSVSLVPEGLKWNLRHSQALFPVRGVFEEKNTTLNDKQWSEMTKTSEISFNPGDRVARYCEVRDRVKGKILGWVFIFEVKTTGGTVPAGVAINSDGLIRSVGVLTLQMGLPIALPLFLNQFEGKGLDSDWSYGVGIQLPEESEKDGMELTQVVRKALYWTKEISGITFRF